MSSDYEKYLEEKRKQKEEWFKKNPKPTFEMRRKHKLRTARPAKAKKRPRKDAVQKKQQRRKYKSKIDVLDMKQVQILKKKQVLLTQKRLEGEEQADRKFYQMIFQVSETEYIPKVRKKGRDWEWKMLVKKFQITKLKYFFPSLSNDKTLQARQITLAVDKNGSIRLPKATESEKGSSRVFCRAPHDAIDKLVKCVYDRYKSGKYPGKRNCKRRDIIGPFVTEQAYKKYKDYYSEDGYTLFAKHNINTNTLGMAQLRHLRSEFRNFITTNYQNEHIRAEYYPTKATIQQMKNAFISKQQRPKARKRMQDHGKEHHAPRINVKKASINRAMDEELRLMKLVRMLQVHHHDLNQFADRLCHVLAPNMNKDVGEWIRLNSAHSSTRANTALSEQADVYNFSPTGMSSVEPQSIVKDVTYIYKEVGGVPKIFCEHGLDRSNNVQTNVGGLLTTGQDDRNVPEAEKLRKHIITKYQHDTSIANGFAPTAMLRSAASATHTIYSLSEPEGTFANRSFDRTRLTKLKNDVEMADSTEICTLESLANVASGIYDSSSDEIDLLTTETLCNSASSNMDKLCNSKGSSVGSSSVIDLTGHDCV